MMESLYTLLYMGRDESPVCVAWRGLFDEGCLFYLQNLIPVHIRDLASTFRGLFAGTELKQRV